MSVVPPSCSGGLTSGRGRPASSRRSSSRSSATLRVGVGPSAMTASRGAAPGWPLARPWTSRSWPTLRRPSACAWRSTRRSAPVRHLRREVERRARGGGDADALPRPDVALIQAARAVHADPADLAAAVAGHGDVGVALVPVDELKPHAGRPVAEDRARAAGEHRRGQAALDGQRVRADDGVDAAVHAVQRPAARPHGDRVAGQPARPQLLYRHHRVLLRCEPRDPHLGGCGALRSLSLRKAPHPSRHAAMVAPEVSQNHTHL